MLFDLLPGDHRHWDTEAHPDDRFEERALTPYLEINAKGYVEQKKANRRAHIERYRMTGKISYLLS